MLSRILCLQTLGTELAGKTAPSKVEAWSFEAQDLGVNPGSALTSCVTEGLTSYLLGTSVFSSIKMGILINLPHSTVMKMERDYACKVLSPMPSRQ